MPRIEIRADKRRLLCDILVLGPSSAVDFDGYRARALIDTGATVSGIGPKAIEALGLKSYGKRPLGSATEERMVSYYLFRLGIMGNDEPNTPRWPYVFDRVDGFSWERPMAFDVIIGMDILQQGDLRLTRDGRCVLDFGT